MSTRFQVKRSTVSGVTPTTGDIAAGELAVNLPDRKLFTSNGSAISELGSNLTSLSVGNTTTVQISNSSGLFVNGNIGIGTTAPSAKLDVVGTNTRLFETVTTDSVGDQALSAHYLDVNMTGTDTLTANRLHTAFRIDVAATATGGNTTTQHLVRGILNTVDVTGTSSQIYGIHNEVSALNTSGTVLAIYAALNLCGSDPGVGGTVATAIGSLNQAYAGGAGVINTIYGTRNEAVVGGTATAGVVHAYGAYNDVEIDGNTLTNGYATISVMNIRGGVTTNAYLYYGNYQGANATNVLNSWGLYLVNATKNYISGNVGINNTAPNATLAVTGTANVSGNVVIGGSLNAANVTATVFTGAVSLSGGIHANGSLGTAGQALVSNGSSAYWGNIFTPTATSLSANVVTTSNVVSLVSELVAAVGTGQVWLVDVFGIYRSAATTTGIRLGISAPTNSTTVNDIRIRQAADGTDSIFEGMTSGNTTISSASVVAANTDYGFTIRSMVRTGNTAGNLNLQLASEVNTSQITLMPGTTMIAIRIQ